MRTPIDVLQLSDVHFAAEPGPLHGRDPEATLAAVVDDAIVRHGIPDVVVVTGDLVHDGSAAGYERLGDALAGIGAPVFCLAGNHDSATAFEAVLPRPGVHIERATRVGDWGFVFLDSNANGRSFDGEMVVDLPTRHVSAFEGAVHRHELAWLDAYLEAVPVEHVAVWLHHPPQTHPRYQGDASSPLHGSLFAVLSRHEKARTVSAGHLHCGFTAEHDGVAILACPSTWLVMDFDTGTIAPPGYRWHRLDADGTVASTVHEVADPRWAERPPVPAWGFALISGQMDLSSLHHLSQDEILDHVASQHDAIP